MKADPDNTGMSYCLSAYVEVSMNNDLFIFKLFQIQGVGKVIISKASIIMSRHFIDKQALRFI